MSAPPQRPVPPWVMPPRSVAVAVLAGGAAARLGTEVPEPSKRYHGELGDDGAAGAGGGAVAVGAGGAGAERRGARGAGRARDALGAGVSVGRWRCVKRRGGGERRGGGVAGGGGVVGAGREEERGAGEEEQDGQSADAAQAARAGRSMREVTRFSRGSCAWAQRRAIGSGRASARPEPRRCCRCCRRCRTRRHRRRRPTATRGGRTCRR